MVVDFLPHPVLPISVYLNEPPNPESKEQSSPFSLISNNDFSLGNLVNDANLWGLVQEVVILPSFLTF